MTGWSLVQSPAQGVAVASLAFASGTTQGNLLICVATAGATGTAITAPAGWTQIGEILNSTVSQTAVFAYFNNPGGITTVAPGGGTGSFILDIGEFTGPNVALVSAASATGTATATATTSITVSTSAAAKAGDLCIVGALEHITTAAAITWTDPSGFTEFTSLHLASSTNHNYAAYELSLAAAGVVSAVVTSSSTAATNGWSAVIATFSLGPAPVTQAEQAPPPRTAVPPASRIITPAPSGGPVSVPLTDSGTGTDALAVTATVALTDAGTGTDILAVSSTNAQPYVVQAEPIPPPQPRPLASQVIQGPPPFAIALTDSGTGTDALGVTATVPLADAGTGTDVLAVSSTEAQPYVVQAQPQQPLPHTFPPASQIIGPALSGPASVALSDSGTGTDALAVTATVALTDTGTGTDALGVVAAGVQPYVVQAPPQPPPRVVPPASAVLPLVQVAGPNTVSLTDAGTGTDALAIVQPTALADAGAATDVLGVAVPVALTDSGTGSDTLSVVAAIPVALADSGTAADALAVAATVALADGGAGADALGPVAAGVALADAAVAFDLMTPVQVVIALADAGTASDVFTAPPPPFVPGTITSYDEPGATVTASDAPAGVITPSEGSNASTASSAPYGAMSSSDQSGGKVT